MKIAGLKLVILAISSLVFAQDINAENVNLGTQESILKVDYFSPKKNKFSVNYGLSYTGTDENGYVPNIIFIDTIKGIVPITTLNSTSDRTDRFTASFGVRYALTNSINLFGQSSGSLITEQATNYTASTYTQTAFDFDNLSFGADFRFTPTPTKMNFNGFVSMSLIERQNQTWLSAKSFTAGVNLLTVIDPLILSTSLTYNHFLKREIQAETHEPGNVITLTPTIGFAVNPDINLSWGTSISYKMPDANNGISLENSAILSSLNLGLSYRLDTNKLLNMNAKAGVAGNDAMQFNINLSHRF